MTNNIFKTGAGLLALIGSMTLAACSDKDEMPTGGRQEGADFSLAIKGMAAAPAAGTQDAISVFQFGPDGLFSKNVMSSYDPEGINLVKGTTRALYCVSGIEVNTSDDITEEAFILTTTDCSPEANSAPLFLSGTARIETAQMQCELTMTRGVARIDLDASDAKMEITSITIEDAPTTTYVFAGNGAVKDAATTTYTKKYDAAPAGVEKGAFMIFESDKDVHVRIEGTADGNSVSVNTVLAGVERNKVYTLRVYGNDATVKAGFSVADWEAGDDIIGGTDLSKGLFIDEAASVIPAGVKVDFLNNIIEVPGDGVKGMKIAFSSEVRVDVDMVCFAGERVLVDSVEAKQVRITPEKAYNTDNGVITKINIDIEPQLKGRPEYELDMYVKKTFMATSYDRVKIRVAPSKFQIATVKLAGIEWMAFNATSPDPDDQTYVDEGKTVEDMYVADWVTCTGGLFQFGRRYMYIPYQSYNPCNDLGGQKQDIPWINESHMPCPEGYHVATINEWLQLVPEETKIEDGTSYTAGNGETINVEVVRLPGDVVTPTNVNGVCRYLKLTSAETGNSLILPYGGYKGDKSTAMSSNFGKDMVYWGNDNIGCPGGYARAIRFMFNWGNSCVPNVFQWQMEAFAYVRAVKNN